MDGLRQGLVRITLFTKNCSLLGEEIDSTDTMIVSHITRWQIQIAPLQDILSLISMLCTVTMKYLGAFSMFREKNVAKVLKCSHK